jgi:hypothetical protein
MENPGDRPDVLRSPRKKRTWIKRHVLLRLIVPCLLAGTAACGSPSGAFVYEISDFRDDALGCHNDWTEDDVRDWQQQGGPDVVLFASGKSCFDLGYTRHCPEYPNTYFLQTYTVLCP